MWWGALGSGDTCHEGRRSGVVDASAVWLTTVNIRIYVCINSCVYPGYECIDMYICLATAKKYVCMRTDTTDPMNCAFS